MTRGETIQMVRKAGFPDGIAEFIGLEAFEALIKLSAEHERKACAEHYLGIMRNAVQSAVEAEREKFTAFLRMAHDSYALASDPGQLKERGTK